MVVRDYGVLRAVRGGWRVVRCEPHVALRLKALFPSIPRAAVAPFTLTGGSQLTTDLHWFLQRYPMEMGDDDRARLEAGVSSFHRAQDELETILSPDWVPPTSTGFRDPYKPYPYQMQASELCLRKGRLLLLDEVGLGKTVSALAMVVGYGEFPAAVVVESHLGEQWQEDFIHEFTNLRAHVIKQTKPYRLPPAEVYIFKYSNLAGWVDYVANRPFRVVVFDEIQSLRNGRVTQKGMAAAVLAGGADLRVGLTATPIYNYGDDMWRIVNFLDPDALGTFTDFSQEWCYFNGRHNIVRDPEALGTYLREQYLVLRRTEEDVGRQLPVVNTIVEEVAYDKAAAAEADALARTLALRVFSGSFVERGQAARELDVLARHTTGVAKSRHVAAFVRLLLKAGEPVLLVGWHREVYDAWLRDLAEFSPVLYTGTESSAGKRRSKEKFVSGETNLLVMSLRSGIGLNGLQTRCCTVVFGELDYSPQVHRQVIGRLRRPGQAKQVTAIYLWANGGSDPVVMDMLGLKASQAHGIIDPLRAPVVQHTDTSRLQRLAEYYLRRREKVPRRRLNRVVRRRLHHAGGEFENAD